MNESAAKPNASRTSSGGNNGNTGKARCHAIKGKGLPVSASLFSRPTREATSKNPTTPTVVLTTNRVSSMPAAGSLPCSILFTNRFGIARL